MGVVYRRKVRDNNNNNNNNNNNYYYYYYYYLTGIGLSPGGSGFKHILQVLEIVLLKFTFTSGGLQEKHVVAYWKVWEPSEHLLIDTGKPRKKPVSRWPVAVKHPHVSGRRLPDCSHFPILIYL